MKRGFTTLLLSISATGLFSTAAFAAGWATNQQGQQVYQNDNGSIATNTWIKMSQNGKTDWYYATANGSLRADGWLKIGENYYYFDSNGIMQTGWVQEDRYYCELRKASVSERRERARTICTGSTSTRAPVKSSMRRMNA